MCGIAGIWGTQLEPAAVERSVGTMLTTLAHRGPDGTGSTAWQGGGLGMVRLALVDLSERGMQPLWSPDRSVAIVFNGEMYNHAVERERLKQRGHRFSSTSDTEVVLALYLEHGLGFVDRVRGMYGLAIADWRERGPDRSPTLLLARDPLGIKPLYVCPVDGSGVAFSSELRPLVRAGHASREIDTEGLNDFLNFGFVLQPRTIFRDIRALPRGSMTVFEPERAPRSHRFWMLPPPSSTALGFEETALRLRETLGESVRLHALADAPVGAFLSGGVDSSGVVAMMARHNPRLRTFTVRYSDGDVDEAGPARAFAEKLGTTHTEVEIGDAEIPGLFEQFASQLDQPSHDGFNTWLVSRAAARQVKGVISGLGGDEWFAGYPVARRMQALERGDSGAVQRRVGMLAEAVPPSFSSSRVDDLAARRSPAGLWAQSHRVFSPAELSQLGVYSPLGTGFDRLAGTLSGIQLSDDPIDLACELDVFAFLGCQLLRDSDVTSMAHSLELRVPLVDVEIAAFARSCPPSFKLDERETPSTKRVLVEAFRPLIPSSAYRKKLGFSLPLERWTRGPLAPLADDADGMLEETGWFGRAPKLASLPAHPQRWALLTLARWYASV